MVCFSFIFGRKVFFLSARQRVIHFLYQRITDGVKLKVLFASHLDCWHCLWIECKIIGKKKEKRIKWTKIYCGTMTNFALLPYLWSKREVMKVAYHHNLIYRRKDKKIIHNKNYGLLEGSASTFWSIEIWEIFDLIASKSPLCLSSFVNHDDRQCWINSYPLQ